MPLGSASSRNGGKWSGRGRAGGGGGGGGGGARPSEAWWGREFGRLGGRAVGRLAPPQPFQPPTRRTAEPPSLGPSARRTRARPDNQQRQTGGIEIGGGDALHIIARDREQFVEIGVDIVDRRVKGAIVLQLFRLPERRFAIGNEPRLRHVFRFLELGRRDAVRANAVELDRQQTIQAFGRHTLIDDAVERPDARSVARA